MTDAQKDAKVSDLLDVFTIAGYTLREIQRVCARQGWADAEAAVTQAARELENARLQIPDRWPTS